MVDHIAPTTLLSYSNSALTSIEDQLAVEEPLEIRLQSFANGQTDRRGLAITMRTPGHDQELALGFLMGEGIIHSIDDVARCEHSGSQALRDGSSNVIQVQLHPGVAVDLDRLQRHFYTSSSCGVCGKASLEALEAIGAEPMSSAEFTTKPQQLLALGEALPGMQSVFQETGGLHAAVLFDSQGEVLCLREDVGRHNAMDKVCGYLLQTQLPPCAVLVSGRASFELMQKALMSGIECLVAVGAPSSLAVDFAREYNMTLIGFMRDNRFNIYAGKERIEVP